MPDLDPMQAVAFARITASELAEDAKRQSAACQEAVRTLETLAETIAQSAGLSFASVDPRTMREVLESLASGVRAIGATISADDLRWQAHAEGWAREEQVWQGIMERSTEKSP